jgi:hypothetical protein
MSAIRHKNISFLIILQRKESEPVGECIGGLLDYPLAVITFLSLNPTSTIVDIVSRFAFHDCYKVSHYFIFYIASPFLNQFFHIIRQFTFEYYFFLCCWMNKSYCLGM